MLYTHLEAKNYTISKNLLKLENIIQEISEQCKSEWEKFRHEVTELKKWLEIKDNFFSLKNVFGFFKLKYSCV